MGSTTERIGYTTTWTKKTFIVSILSSKNPSNVSGPVSAQLKIGNENYILSNNSTICTDVSVVNQRFTDSYQSEDYNRHD